MPKSEPRAGIRARTRQTESRSTASDPRSILRLEPVMRSPQQPLRSRRRPSTLPQVSGSGSRDPPSAPSLENHEACLATVETLEREIEALQRDKETLSERVGSVESEIQELLNEQHQWRQQLPERRATQQLMHEMQHTVASWHQRLRSPAGLPEKADPAAVTTALPAMIAVPDMWNTQEDGGGAFDNDHGIEPDSGDFTQLFQF
ncbi:hypothetical protein CBS76997_11369 [Aspergillus niger]|nr:hypothetical protein CBS13152_11388 [Aspergillus niger]KAI2867043.1 hypothetical protein CBS11852_11465 [Aspergillus niger]KAI2948615.1 hypothetical protein CBS147323_11042 [Aspergillus niger]KAI3032891.1 hypothetical protein CBS76997_11369 [Aspergillus niger]